MLYLLDAKRHPGTLGTESTSVRIVSVNSPSQDTWVEGESIEWGRLVYIRPRYGLYFDVNMVGTVVVRHRNTVGSRKFVNVSVKPIRSPW